MKSKCFWCKKEIIGSLHVDHVVPKVLGGASSKWNYVDSCRACNLSKNRNIWLSGERMFIKPQQFVAHDETKDYERIVVSTVYIYKKPYRRQGDAYEGYGEPVKEFVKRIRINEDASL